MKLNKASMTGFLFCLVAILFGIATNGGIRTILNFWHFPSLMVTMGGALFAVMITADSSMGSDPSAVGEGMSLALITTLYGSVLANWICIPIARRLNKKSDAEYLVREIIIEGVLSIQAGDNPRIIKEKIKALVEENDDVEG